MKNETGTEKTTPSPVEGALDSINQSIEVYGKLQSELARRISGILEEELKTEPKPVGEPDEAASVPLVKKLRDIHRSLEHQKTWMEKFISRIRL